MELIARHQHGPQIAPEWRSAQSIKSLPQGRTLTCDPPKVHRGQNIEDVVRRAESLAVGQSVLDYAPHSRASHDIDQLSRWLVTGLNQRAH